MMQGSQRYEHAKELHYTLRRCFNEFLCAFGFGYRVGGTVRRECDALRDTH
jgi:hypothetical protein